MSSINLAMIAGNVGRDPELRSAGGTEVVEFSVATTDRWRDKSGAEKSQTEWHRVVLWGNGGSGFPAIVAKHVRKGMTVSVTGKIRYRDWTDKDGNKRTTTEILAQDIVWDSSGSGSSSSTGDRSRSSGTASRNQSKPGPPPQDGFNDDDIPF